jgi:hypothetical protein
MLWCVSFSTYGVEYTEGDVFSLFCLGDVLAGVRTRRNEDRGQDLRADHRLGDALRGVVD